MPQCCRRSLASKTTWKDLASLLLPSAANSPTTQKPAKNHKPPIRVSTVPPPGDRGAPTSRLKEIFPSIDFDTQPQRTPPSPTAETARQIDAAAQILGRLPQLPSAQHRKSTSQKVRELSSKPVTENPPQIDVARHITAAAEQLGTVPTQRAKWSSSSTATQQLEDTLSKFATSGNATGTVWKAGNVSAANFAYEVIEPPKSVPVPALAHGLEKVLFTPGVHHLQDPKTNEFNFDPWLKDILQPEKFNFDALPRYITASADDTLWSLAKEHKARYLASTSSITSLLSRVYLAVANHRKVERDTFSPEFRTEPDRFTRTARGVTAAVLRFRDGIYAIDYEKPEDDDEESIMMSLGKSMEKMLTADPTEFDKFTKANADKLDEESRGDDSYHYAKAGGFLLRAQLDCQHPNLPKKSFDLKTRAALAIRMDPANYAENTGYKVTQLQGLYQSFEREYYDMLRSTFIKYYFQARIGNMDGILVAYHNTSEIFGFQYVPIAEMDKYLFGNSVLGDQAFAVALRVLETVLDGVCEEFWGQDVRIYVDPKKEDAGVLIVCAEPLADEDGASEETKGETSAEKGGERTATTDAVSANVDTSTGSASSSSSSSSSPPSPSPPHPSTATVNISSSPPVPPSAPSPSSSAASSSTSTISTTAPASSSSSSSPSTSTASTTSTTVDTSAHTPTPATATTTPTTPTTPTTAESDSESESESENESESESESESVSEPQLPLMLTLHLRSLVNSVEHPPSTTLRLSDTGEDQWVVEYAAVKQRDRSSKIEFLKMRRKYNEVRRGGHEKFMRQLRMVADFGEEEKKGVAGDVEGGDGKKKKRRKHREKGVEMTVKVVESDQDGEGKGMDPVGADANGDVGKDTVIVSHGMPKGDVETSRPSATGSFEHAAPWWEKVGADSEPAASSCGSETQPVATGYQQYLDKSQLDPAGC
ncbi:hypothetical protein HK104_001198 [Borealophlyctis nickersoniae]|nr:hypothetical protein HK104_001198 [Borealophlyctis nickersoniae]